MKKRKWLIVEIFLFALLYSLLSVRRHLRFDSFAFDLGIFDQVIWLYSRFQAPFSTIKEKIILGDHFSPSLIFLAPLFWLINDVKILLIFQAFFLSFSAYPIFLSAKRRDLSDCLALVVCSIYLAFFGFQHALNFDFHENVIAAALFPWLLLFLEEKCWREFVLVAILFAGLKENLALTLAGLGGIIFWQGQRKKGFLLTVLVLVYFFLIIRLIIPHFSPVGWEYRPQLPANLVSALRQLFYPQEKLRTWFHSLAWFSFLPLLSAKAMLMVIIDLAQYFLSGEKYAATWGLFMHYRACLGPFLAWGMIDGLTWLQKKFRPQFFTSLILILPIFFQYSQHLPLNRLIKSY